MYFDFPVILPPNEIVDGDVVEYIAANPVDRRMSFSGSALPYADARQAFYGTPNRGKVHLNSKSNTYELRFAAPPSSYYANLKGDLVPPTVYILWRSQGKLRRGSLRLGEPVPFRSISMPRRPSGNHRTVATYDVPYPFMRSQEEILIASAYPSYNAENMEAKEPPNFWGTRPPV